MEDKQIEKQKDFVEKCEDCKQIKRRKGRKLKYTFFFVFFLVLSLAIKRGYEKAFCRTAVREVLNDFLNLKIVTNMSLSQETKQNILKLAEYAHSPPSDTTEEIPGEIADKKGLKKKHPFIIIPGIANTNLELWRTKKESNAFFRKKIWGSHSTFTFMLHNRAEWIKSMMLNEKTGLDPEKIKVRAVPGLESSDFSIPGMWFWWKIIENLSHIGYDISSVHFAGFDWRLGMHELEERDGYFTRLKAEIEHQVYMSKEKVFMVAHSLGSLVSYHFMQWVSENDKSWVDKHVQAVAYIGAPLLGVPKAISCLLTGESLDTMEMGLIQSTVVELLFGRKERKELFRTWSSAVILLPKGGELFWEGSQADEAKQNTIISIVDEEDKKNIPLSESFKRIRASLTEHNRKLLDRSSNPKEHKDTWHNPLLSPLPHAPNMKIYSLYGVGKQTERAYRVIKDEETQLLAIDKRETDKELSLYRGIYTVDGDGTVPLLSTGYMGYAGWKDKKLNPSGIPTINREYVHDPSKDLLALRGGPKTAQHINILGNHELIMDLLKIAAGQEVEQRIVSDLPKIAENIKKKQSTQCA
ncbi:phospholipid:diacylglycerol acyltransferase [Nematocida sp. LUAm3]|nr:phospholipid:diacylglycerol acyltransferase [Nematocida sp. LUAm3]KAI5174690.1 phospholipid:diacylglycerol acyltransferase [Nematocida sp. LUAm2]KAI5177899.1 phospholipid:diacylglycerol acyltransferase [Nematocida sp. LUAm1]